MLAAERVFWRSDEIHAALSAEPATDVLDLARPHVEAAIARGEPSWLADRGIECGFVSY